MTVEVTLKSTMEPSIVEGEFIQFINDLNLAAAKGMQFVIATERRDGEAHPVAFETRNITRIRDLKDHDAFIS